MSTSPARSSRSWLAVALLYAVTVFLAYQSRTTLSLDLGALGDGPFVAGFHERISEPGFSRRWSRQRSTIRLPGIAWHRDLRLLLRLSPDTRPADSPAEVAVAANGAEVARFRADPGFRNYRVAVPARLLSAGGVLRIELQVSPFRQGPQEDLGVVVEKAKLEPSGEDLALPPPLVWLGWTLNGVLWFAALKQTALARKRRALATTVGAGVAALGAAVALVPHWTALGTERAAIALGVLHAAAWQVRRWRQQEERVGRLDALHTLGIDSRRWRVRVECLVVALAALQFGLNVLRPLQAWGPKDFRIYHGAGTLWLEGGDYYDIPAFRARFGPDVPSETGFAFTNPPSGAALYALLALLPIDEALVAWRVLNDLLLAASAILLWSSTRRTGDPSPSPVWVALAVRFSEPLRITLRMSQVGVLVLFLLVLAVWSYQRRRGVLAGASLAAAALVKLLPGFPAIYFLWRRDWRASGAAAISGIAGLGVLVWAGGSRQWLTFVRRVLPALSAPVAFFGDQSIMAFLHRAAGMPPVPARFNYTFAPPPPEPLVWRLAPYLIAGVLIAAAYAGIRRRRSSVPLVGALELATTIPLMLLVAPLVWEFYLLWLLVTYHVVLAVLTATRLPRRVHVVAVVLVGASWALVQFDTTDVYRLPGWPVALMSLGLYATALAFGCCLYLLRHLREPPAVAALVGSEREPAAA